MTKSPGKRQTGKMLTLAAIVLATVAIAGFLFYKLFLPGIIATAIVEDKTPTYLPESLATKIDKYKAPLNYSTETVIYNLDSLKIPFSLILKYVDSIEKEKIQKTYDEIKTEKKIDPNKVFDIVKSNIKVTEVDPEIFRPIYLSFATKGRIERVINYIDMHHLMDEIDVSLSREVIKKILIQKREEIDKRINAMGGPHINLTDTI